MIDPAAPSSGVILSSRGEGNSALATVAKKQEDRDGKETHCYGPLCSVIDARA
jgi:hypothetical protein